MAVRLIFHDMDPMSLNVEIGAKNIVAMCRWAGVTPHIVTARAHHDKQQTIDWCKLHELQIEDQHIHHVDFTGSKAGLIKNMGQIKFYVDDNADHVAAAELLTNIEVVYLMDRPWNQGAQCGVRVRNFEELLDHQFNRVP